MSEHDCLNNEDQLDSVLEEVAQIDSEFDSYSDLDSDIEGVVEVVKETKVDYISVNGQNIPPDKNKNVNIVIPTTTSGFKNDGDGTSPFATEDKVQDKFNELIGLAPETLDTLEEIAEAIKENEDFVDTLDALVNTKADKTALQETNSAVMSNSQEIENVRNSIQYYHAGEGLSLDSENKFSVVPATKQTLGSLRVWEDEDGYLCFSTELSSGFTNIYENGILKMIGAYNATLNNGTLVLE